VSNQEDDTNDIDGDIDVDVPTLVSQFKTTGDLSSSVA